jgi:hypothetical protein
MTIQAMRLRSGMSQNTIAKRMMAYKNFYNLPKGNNCTEYSDDVYQIIKESKNFKYDDTKTLIFINKI